MTPPPDVLRRTGSALRRVLGQPGEGLAGMLDAVADGNLDAAQGLQQLGRVLERSGDGAAALLTAIDAELELLRWLVEHGDTRVTAAAITAASQTGFTTWFARDPAPAVRRAVAEHASGHPRLLEILAADTAESVRLVVAARDALPESVATMLATDESWQVRFALAGRAGLPGVVVRRLAEDPDRRVQARVAARPAPVSGHRLAAAARLDDAVLHGG